MKIKFNETVYNLVDTPNIHGTRFQATIEKEGVVLDSLLSDINDISKIILYDDEDNVIGIYTGYTHQINISIMEYISIELENTNIKDAITNLQDQVNDLSNNIRSNGVVKVIFSNVSSLPKTEYDPAILSTMSLLNKEISNPNVAITDFGVIISNGSVTLNGVVSGTTDVTLYLTN